MRVPVYPDDLIRNRGFKSLSKQLQEQWYGSTPISLAEAQKVLARGLGYQSFHDLNEASKICSPDAPVPPEADVRQAIRSAIGTTLQPEALRPLDQQKLERLVNDLSLKKLVAFRNVQVSPSAGHSPSAVIGAIDGLAFRGQSVSRECLHSSGSPRTNLKAMMFRTLKLGFHVKHGRRDWNVGRCMALRPNVAAAAIFSVSPSRFIEVTHSIALAGGHLALSVSPAASTSI
ncbi:hypothetical protein [Pseudomonas syringae]|uniref:Uncharacterized protein n=1 Tax=Pseudomonas syringae TaxID=317 RepID=A0AB38BVT8_PSESX|nr:hypothetical protein [Pseudomonas syringae]MCK0550971.1 hypothetical protein [Pseudomonas syringae pv. aptata]SFO21757.1 hypothetical protein SAMN05444065_109280 [Pseudomonas syringae]SFO66012.1 hypothetical protein SAMN05444063_1148 [Pseudomonas syringae]